MENRVLIEVTNNSEHNFACDGEWLRAGEWKSNQKVDIKPKSLSMIELQSTQARGVQGVIWWTDTATHEVYISMAVANPRLQAPTFACWAGLPPGNLKSELGGAPRLAQAEVRTGSGCQWVGAGVGNLTVVRLTIHEDLSRYSSTDAGLDGVNAINGAASATGNIASGSASSSTAPADGRVDSVFGWIQPNMDMPECTELATQDQGGNDMTSAKEQMSKFMAQTRPKDAADGLGKGLKTVSTSILAGVSTVVVSTVAGTQQGGPLGFVKGIGCGLVGGVAITVGGTVCGVAQIGRGIINTPESFRSRREHRVWDGELGEWVDIDLVSLEREVEDETSDDETEGRAGNCEVLETEYYDLLKLQPNATQNEIKKAYHKEARQCHPDKNPGDSEAKVKFQKLGAAYQVLSDPETRKQYDREGTAGIEESAPNLDPSVFFSLLFGSERFDPWMGELNLAMQTDQFTKAINRERQSERSSEEAFQDTEKTAEVLKRRQFRREVRCACHLRNKLDRWVLGRDQKGWEEQIRLEAVDLVSAQFGQELLMTLGEIYQLRAQLYLDDELVGRFSMKKRTHSLRHSMLCVRHRMSFVRNATSSLVSVKRIHDATKKMNDEDPPATEEGQEPTTESEEASRRMVEEALDIALPTFLQTAWASVVTDIDNTMKEVGRKLLKDKSVPWQIRIRRAQALFRLGEIFTEEGAKASATQGATLMSSEAAKTTLQEALVESVREKKKGSTSRRREEHPSN